MILASILNLFKRYKLIISVMATAICSFAGSAAMYFQDEVKLEIKEREAKVEIFTPTPKVELNKKIEIEARIDSVGRDELSPGILSLETDTQYISLKPSRSVELGSISGSHSVDGLPEVAAIKISNKPVKITARYISGGFSTLSNDLYIEIVKPLIATHPHFDLSDTGRINLSGEWEIQLGGVPGTMTIRQGTDNKINGAFSVPGGIWSAGAVSGHKDGKTFRAHFSVPGKENTETIRVAGYFDLNGPSGELIELEGCAYHLQRSPLTYENGGTEGVECTTTSVFYDYWEVMSAVRFYAKSPFEK